jgi:hypothetical protein
MRRTGRALLLVAVLALAGCGDDGGAGEVGDLVQGRLGDLDGTSYALLVPNGRLTVVVTDGQDTLGATEAADGQERDAPAGTEWVALDWRLEPGVDLDALQRTLMEDTGQRTTLALVTGDGTVDLGDAPGSSTTPSDTRTSGTVWVAVDEDAAPVLEVAFDDLTTSLDTGSGEVSGDMAAALGGLEEPTTGDCAPLRAPGGAADVACAYVVTRVPYLAGQGWSDEGWTVAQVETRVDEFERAGATYAVQSVQDASTMEGADGSTVVDERLDSLVSRLVAAGAPAQLEVRRDLQGVRTDGRGPDEATLTVSGVVDLG